MIWAKWVWDMSDTSHLLTFFGYKLSGSCHVLLGVTLNYTVRELKNVHGGIKCQL